MLKTRQDNELWLVQQPDHAQVAGYLAAHWGGAGGFARPGCFGGGGSVSGSADVSVERAWQHQEVVQAIAQHDNGWWEWEASPSIDPSDHWPRHLTDMGQESAEAGLQRWRLGIPRLADEHPLIALMISYHAWWLYAFAFDDLIAAQADADAFRHPLFGADSTGRQLVSDPMVTRTFLQEQLIVQLELSERLQANPRWSAAAVSEQLWPNVRLLQVMDAISLVLCLGGGRDLVLPNIPRSSWQDRVEMQWTAAGTRHIVCDPYPFDLDPLPVYLPVRIAPLDDASTAAVLQRTPLIALHRLPLTTIRFELRSA